MKMASQEGHTTTVDVLLRQGADPNIADNVRKLQSSVLTMYLSIHTHNVLTVITQTATDYTRPFVCNDHYHSRMSTTNVHAVCGQ